ncbi:hypothetical protein M2246_005295 [Bacillus sp. LEw-kw-24]|nr:hypothetical protein [Bacillus sp. LEw-kw-24]MDF9890059.1 hypothetical protein [Bacillus sp. LEw-kw-24]
MLTAKPQGKGEKDRVLQHSIIAVKQPDYSIDKFKIPIHKDEK